MTTRTTRSVRPADTAVDTRRWFALVVILIATFMAILDTFIVNVAIPSIQHGLQMSFGEIQLVIAGYTLAYAVGLITGGRLGDIYGRKRLFVVGMLGFTLFSLICGLAPSGILLIIARIAQGLAAALMIPQVLALIQVNFRERERGIAFGFYGATVGLASIAGQILGGFLITSNAFGLGWRNVFLVNVPIGILAVLAAIPLIRESRVDGARSLDLGGVGILSVALFLLTYPLVEGRDAGWPLWAFLCLILTLPVFAGFVFYEHRLSRKQGSPLLPLSLFKDRTFDLGMIAALVFYSGNAALFFILALYLQMGLGFSALAAGLTFMPLGIGFALTSLIAPRLVPHLGGTWILRSGAIVMFLGELSTLWAVLQTGFHIREVELVLPLLVVGLGEGIVAAPLINTILAGIQAQNVGVASGVLTTTTQVANALGVAFIGIIFFGVLRPGAQPALSYGQAFEASTWAIAALALLTLLFVSLLPSAKKPRATQESQSGEATQG
ncbi:MFS transporter [Ktedonosporobacter rubrisoli]|uniref:MFS transporter n=1 Tax=Ktedonosporobacter rubrisoli TaxID=2509675 RepID=A0A4P6JK79_KTERU|nr:MFS transporter [Ktedonosporobacter rubrisoli]QBD75549.1 MFS transporter [Ktedonosporobacter rubrisoli]